ncbi:unnamed protein product [Merluccius merluccius]
MKCYHLGVMLAALSLVSMVTTELSPMQVTGFFLRYGSNNSLTKEEFKELLSAEFTDIQITDEKLDTCMARPGREAGKVKKEDFEEAIDCVRAP